MVTCKILIRPYLAEYLRGKYGIEESNPIRFSDDSDLYHTIYDLMIKRPINCMVDRGNLEFVLPDRSVGKDPKYYNYLSERSVRILEKRIMTMFQAEVHEYLDEQKHVHGVYYVDACSELLERYGIMSITEDALIKSHQRWRAKMRRRKVRSYRKTNNK